MNMLDMYTPTDNEPVLGISTSFAEGVIRDQILSAPDGDWEKKLDRAMLLIEENAYPRPHAEAEDDTDFIQLVPCVMVQAIPTRKVKTLQGAVAGYDQPLLSICAHGHVTGDRTIHDAILEMVQAQLGITPEQSFGQALIGMYVAAEPPANDRHLILLYTKEIVDFKEKRQEKDGIVWDWADPDALQSADAMSRLDPWCQLVHAFYVPVADATGRDLTMHFYMEDGDRHLEIERHDEWAV